MNPENNLPKQTERETNSEIPVNPNNPWERLTSFSEPPFSVDTLRRIYAEEGGEAVFEQIQNRPDPDFIITTLQTALTSASEYETKTDTGFSEVIASARKRLQEAYLIIYTITYGGEELSEQQLDSIVPIIPPVFFTNLINAGKLSDVNPNDLMTYLLDPDNPNLPESNKATIRRTLEPFIRSFLASDEANDCLDYYLPFMNALSQSLNTGSIKKIIDFANEIHATAKRIVDEAYENTAVGALSPKEKEEDYISLEEVYPEDLNIEGIQHFLGIAIATAPLSEQDIQKAFETQTPETIIPYLMEKAIGRSRFSSDVEKYLRDNPEVSEEMARRILPFVIAYKKRFGDPEMIKTLSNIEGLFEKYMPNFSREVRKEFARIDKEPIDQIPQPPSLSRVKALSDEIYNSLFTTSKGGEVVLDKKRAKRLPRILKKPPRKSLLALVKNLPPQKRRVYEDFIKNAPEEYVTRMAGIIMPYLAGVYTVLSGRVNRDIEKVLSRYPETYLKFLQGRDKALEENLANQLKRGFFRRHPFLAILLLSSLAGAGVYLQQMTGLNIQDAVEIVSQTVDVARQTADTAVQTTKELIQSNYSNAMETARTNLQRYWTNSNVLEFIEEALRKKLIDSIDTSVDIQTFISRFY